MKKAVSPQTAANHSYKEGPSKIEGVNDDFQEIWNWEPDILLDLL